jgi:hypothetical protein
VIVRRDIARNVNNSCCLLVRTFITYLSARDRFAAMFFDRPANALGTSKCHHSYLIGFVAAAIVRTGPSVPCLPIQAGMPVSLGWTT